ncbi:transglutaminase family protein [Rhizosphaericola mali]|uniref:Transglutaminase family protein n=1 Tax=Rhizosphaericola mali TaxID=2545455 RepID=A0A5P2G5Y4_9BACT|nr:transglutaminase family protein [Rhizosphaericola mali]QES89619.1 transglutaminase family protein [Rhizosphaericola mali]
MAIFEIKHITKYKYDVPVFESVNEIKIFPLQCQEQEVKSQEVIISNHPDVFHFFDYWGNKTGVFNVLESHQTLEIESRLKIVTFNQNVPSLNLHATVGDLSSLVPSDIRLIELTTPDHIAHHQALKGVINGFFQKSTVVASVVSDCAFYVYQHLNYTKGITTTETNVDEILNKGGGVCQDFAHVLLEMLRIAGIPARYVSGYICSNNGQMRGEGATHAWVEAFIPDFGWAGIDPANNIWVTDMHVKLAIGRSFADCSPTKGVFRGFGIQSLSVLVNIGFEDGSVLENESNVNEYEEAGVTIPEPLDALKTETEDAKEQKQQ